MGNSKLFRGSQLRKYLHIMPLTGWLIDKQCHFLLMVSTPLKNICQSTNYPKYWGKQTLLKTAKSHLSFIGRYFWLVGQCLFFFGCLYTTLIRYLPSCQGAQLVRHPAHRCMLNSEELMPPRWNSTLADCPRLVFQPSLGNGAQTASAEDGRHSRLRDDRNQIRSRSSNCLRLSSSKTDKQNNRVGLAPKCHTFGTKVSGDFQSTGFSDRAFLVGQDFAWLSPWRGRASRPRVQILGRKRLVLRQSIPCYMASWM